MALSKARRNRRRRRNRLGGKASDHKSRMVLASGMAKPQVEVVTGQVSRRTGRDC
jgi:hypothetical protein